MRRMGCIGLILAGLALAATWGLSGWYGRGPLQAPLRITIAQGTSVRSVAHLLAEKGAIRSVGNFTRFARLLGGGKGIKAGAYKLAAGESAAHIYAQIAQGKTEQLLITIPEGMPSIMVQERLAAAQGLTGTTPLPPEGSVLPDSYAYEAGEPRAAVLKRMEAAMTQALDEAWDKRSASSVVDSKEQAIILASIVEKETGKADERPLVAGVYSNRLRLGMRLQADPTVIYPITQGKPLGRRIRKSELEAHNGYNTYAMTGLPKGPIANPGIASIRAVLDPAETKALYFVADGTGGHAFADTLDEQNANVQKWYAIRRARGEM
ncbi:MAG: endolytic transglycosylase MltG [Alphaproteobacteria bacterium]|nr:endolytic transglycosylase MltG [Alphaproteobacteria bacterium]MDE2340882.1 endolytic transglycosylase MltG [Alphaproteobacteria bacterium]